MGRNDVTLFVGRMPGTANETHREMYETYLRYSMDPSCETATAMADAVGAHLHGMAAAQVAHLDLEDFTVPEYRQFARLASWLLVAGMEAHGKNDPEWMLNYHAKQHVRRVKYMMEKTFGYPLTFHGLEPIA